MALSDNIMVAVAALSRGLSLLQRQVKARASLVHTHDAADVVSGVFNVGRIPALPMEKVTGLATAFAGKADLTAIPVKASAADVRTGTDDAKFLTPKSVADAAALVALVDAATIAVDLAAGTNFVLTLGGNRTLGAPANAKPGMSGTILVKQDATGGRTLAYNTAWKSFGPTPALSLTAGAVDLLTWIVEDADKVRFSLTKGGAA